MIKLCTSIAFSLAYLGGNSQALVTPDSAFAINGRIAIETGVSMAGSSNGFRSINLYPDGKILLVSTCKLGGGLSQGAAFAARLNADGTLDETFGTGGKTIVSGEPDDGEINAADIGSDNKIIICGSRQNPFTFINEIFLVKLNAGGTPDEGFGTAGKLLLNISPINSVSEGRDVHFLSDGKILVYARSRYVSGNPGFEFTVARLNADGSLDTTFGNNGISFIIDSDNADSPYRMAVQDDGKIVVAGIFSPIDPQFKIARINSDGSIDSTFGINGVRAIERGSERTPNLRDLIIQQDGKILASGNYSIGAGNSQLTIVRLNQDGSIDQTFGSNGIVNLVPIDLGNKLLEDTEGRILAVGNSFDQVKIARLTTNGQPDLTFGDDGFASLGNANPGSTDLTAAFISNERVLIAGSWTNNSKNYYSVVKVKFGSASTPSALSEPESQVLQVFPNPTNGIIYIQSETTALQIELLDLSGRKLSAVFNPDKSYVDISNLQAGVYLLNVTYLAGKTSVSKIVKTN